jgi:hypothetical protein
MSDLEPFECSFLQFVSQTSAQYDETSRRLAKQALAAERKAQSLAEELDAARGECDELRGLAQQSMAGDTAATDALVMAVRERDAAIQRAERAEDMCKLLEACREGDKKELRVRWDTIDRLRVERERLVEAARLAVTTLPHRPGCSAYGDFVRNCDCAMRGLSEALSEPAAAAGAVRMEPHGAVPTGKDGEP